MIHIASIVPLLLHCLTKNVYIKMYINICKSDFFSGDNEGFLSLSTTDIFEQIIFCCVCSVVTEGGMKKYFIYCRMFSKPLFDLAY